MSRRRRPGEQRVEQPQKRPRSLDRIKVTVPVEEVAASARAAHERSVAAGARFTTTTTTAGGVGEVRRFVRWLDALGLCGLDAITVEQPGRIKRRIVPVQWLLRYAAVIAIPERVAVTSWRGALNNLTGGLELLGVETEDWPHKPSKELTARLEGIAERAGLPERGDRPALPILADDAAAIAAAIDGHHQRDVDAAVLAVMRAALKVFNNVGFWAWGRSGEMVEHLRWRDVPDELSPGEGWAVTWRAGKWQKVPVTLKRGAHLDPDPVAAVAELRAALAVIGVHPQPDDALLPGLVGGVVVLNPLDHADIDRHGEIAARGVARDLTTRWYRLYWTEAARRAGLRATGSRRLSPHGFRRGPATAAAIGGAPLESIRIELRHSKHGQSTILYCDEQEINMAEVVALLDEVDAGRPGATPAELLALIAGNDAADDSDDSDDSDDRDEVDDGDVSSGRCWVEGCDLAAAWQRTLDDDTRVQLCQEHARSHALGGDDWTELTTCEGLRCERPAVQREVGALEAALCRRCWQEAGRASDPTDFESWAPPPPPLCELCTDDGVVARGRIGAARIRACAGHLSRWLRAGSPDELTDELRAPIRRRTQPVGELPCAWCGDPDRMSARWVPVSDTEEVPVCHSHGGRWDRAGQPLPVPDEVSMAIRPTVTGGPCDVCFPAGAAVPDPLPKARISRHRLEGAGDDGQTVAACNAHKQRWDDLGRPLALSEEMLRPLRTFREKDEQAIPGCLERLRELAGSDDHDTHAMVAAYEAGASIQKIADAIGVTRGVADRRLKQHFHGSVGGPAPDGDASALPEEPVPATDPAEVEVEVPVRRPLGLCELCTDGAVAKGRIGAARIGACAGHLKRWRTAGRPDELTDELRAPVRRRAQPAAEQPCAWCGDPHRMSERWVPISETESVPVCAQHAWRWNRAGEPVPVPAEVSAPIRSAVTGGPCELCFPAGAAVPDPLPRARISRHRIEGGDGEVVAACDAHKQRWDALGRPPGLSEEMLRPVRGWRAAD
ncbi:MAG TPA: hypothetical protein DCS55_08260 [Acidimicrobiaceae bacterium]|nr:hypothetical protein [Acidimicrobiaceae bacterium]